MIKITDLEQVELFQKYTNRIEENAYKLIELNMSLPKDILQFQTNVLLEVAFNIYEEMCAICMKYDFTTFNALFEELQLDSLKKLVTKEKERRAKYKYIDDLLKHFYE